MVRDVELSQNTGYIGDQGTNSGKPGGYFGWKMKIKYEYQNNW